MLGPAGQMSSLYAPGLRPVWSTLGVISRCFFGCVLREWGGSYMLPPRSCAFCSHESYFVCLVTNHAFGLRAPLWVCIVV